MLSELLQKGGRELGGNRVKDTGILERRTQKELLHG